jgi:DNA-binding transcriptional regulator YiaG
MLNDEDRMKSEDIKRILKITNWSMRRLGMEVGVTGQTVWLWTKGKSRPSGPANLLLKQLAQSLEGRKELLPTK